MRTRPPRAIAKATLLSLSLTCLASLCPAIEYIWNGGTPSSSNASWSNTNNWNNLALPVGSTSAIITFGAVTGSGRRDPNQNLENPFNLSTLVFDDDAPSYTLSGNRLNFVNFPRLYVFDNSPQPHQIQLPISLAEQLDCSIFGANGLTFSGQISGPGRLLFFRSSAGTPLISIQGANIHSGGTSIGTVLGTFRVMVNHDQAFGTGTVTVRHGSGFGGTDGARNFGNNFVFNTSSGDSGELKILSGSNLTLSGQILVDSGLTGLRIDNSVTTFAGPIVSSVPWKKVGPGTLVLSTSDPSGFTAPLTITEGRVRLGRNTALFQSNVTVAIDDGLDLNGLSDPLIGSLAGPGLLKLGNSNLTLACPIDTTYSGVLSHAGIGKLNKNGAGRLELTGVGSSVARLWVVQGELALQGSLTATQPTGESFAVGSANAVGVLRLSGNGQLETTAGPQNLIAGLNGTGVFLEGSSTQWKAGAIVLGSPTANQDRGQLSIDGGLVEAASVRLGSAVTGQASVSLIGGGRLVSGPAVVGFGGPANVTLTGGGSSWKPTSVQFGGDGAAAPGAAGSLTIDPGASVTVSGRATFWNAASSVTVKSGALACGSLETPTGANPSLIISDASPAQPALTVGSDGTACTFAGTIFRPSSDLQATLRKVGAGTFTLTNTHILTRLLIDAGQLRLTQSHPAVTYAAVLGGATLELGESAGVSLGNASSTLVIDTNGTVRAQPGTTIAGSVLNYGLITGPAVGPPGGLQFTGPVENRGTLRFVNGATLTSAGPLTNYGRIDVITGSLNTGPGFQNSGEVLEAASVRVSDIAIVNGQVLVTMLGYAGHRYQLQRSTSLAAGTFTNIGAPRITSEFQDETLTFADPDPAGATAFYRVAIDG